MNKRRGLGRGLDALLAGGRGGAARGRPQHPPRLWLRRRRRAPARMRSRRRRCAGPHADPACGHAASRPLSARLTCVPKACRNWPIDPRAGHGAADPAAGPGGYEIIAGERRWRAQLPVCMSAGGDPEYRSDRHGDGADREYPAREPQSTGRIAGAEASIRNSASPNSRRRKPSAVREPRCQSAAPVGAERRRKTAHRAPRAGNGPCARCSLQGAQSHAAEQVVARGLSVRETEQLMRRLQAQSGADQGARAAPARVDPDVQSLQRELSERLGASVAIECNAKGKGRLVISYTSLDELQGILEHIK